MKAEGRGFTLIELMVALAVIGVVAVMGIPGIKALLENNQVTARTNRLVASIHLARSEAVKRNAPVSICPSVDGKRCAGQWEDGWIVITKDNNKKDVLLLVERAPKKHVKINADSGVMTFNGDGTVVGSNAIEIVKASFSRKLVVTRGGSVSTCNPATDTSCDGQ